MSKFKKTEIFRFPELAVNLSEGNSWTRLSHPTTVQEYGAIDNLDIAYCNLGQDGDMSVPLVAITSYSKVQIYNPEINEVLKTFTKFKTAAHGARFRSDGRLLCVGTSEGEVKIFDVATKTILRILRGHTSATHRCDFAAVDSSVATFSDDKTVGVWDLATETRTATMTGHTDYIRAGMCSPGSTDVIVSGSYDHTVRLWDRRAGGDPVMTITMEDDKRPVEDVLVLPGGCMLVSASGNGVQFWDIVAGGRKLHSIAPLHHKTVTCLGTTDAGAAIVTGSLDRQVKKVDIKSFSVLGSVNYPSSVLSVAVPSDDKFVVAGMVDGLVQIHKARPETTTDPESGRHQMGGRRAKQRANYKYLRFTQFSPSVGDIVVEDGQKASDFKHDVLLRRFEYSKALTLMLKPYIRKKHPENVYSLLYELVRREGLTAAIVGRDEKDLMHLLVYLNHYITDVRFSRLLVHVAERVIDIYLPNHGMSKRIDKLFEELGRRLEKELMYLAELTQLLGAVDLVLAAGEDKVLQSRVETSLFSCEAVPSS